MRSRVHYKPDFELREYLVFKESAKPRTALLSYFYGLSRNYILRLVISKTLNHPLGVPS